MKTPLFFRLRIQNRSSEPLLYVDPATGGLVVGMGWGMLGILSAFLGAFFLKAWRMPKKWLGIAAIIILLAILGFILSGTMKNNQYMTNQKVLLIGLDGFDAKVIEQLMAEGKLPNFKKFQETESYTRMKTTTPPETPVAVGTVLTGKNPGESGIFDFISRDPKTYLPKLSLYEESQSLGGTAYSRTLKAAPLWEMANKAGIPATFIRWPLSFPPSKIIGNMLSGLGTVDIRGFMNDYRVYTSDSVLKQGEGLDNVIVVKPEGDIITSTITGPFLAGKEKQEATIPITIRLAANHAVLQAGGIEYGVNAGEWSPWIRVKFPVGFLQNVYAIFKVRLISLEPEFRMYMTSLQIDPENPAVAISSPKGYSKELAQEIGLFYTMGMPEDTKAVTEGKVEKAVFLEQIQQIEKERTKMFWYEFNRFKNGLLAFYFDSSDRLQHMYWEEEKIAEPIEEYYKEKDVLLGEILRRLDDNTRLIIFSDHGFTSFKRAVTINTWLADQGYLTLTKPISEQDAGELFQYVDWQNTRAYSLGFASIYINLKGREDNGVVEVNEYTTLTKEIKQKLEQLIDPQTDTKPITAMYETAEIYSGPYTKEGPDLVVGFADGYRMSWQNALGGFSTDIFQDNTKEWKGDHLVDPSHVPAILFANFELPAQPHLRDIAPTVLSLFGLEMPK